MHMFVWMQMDCIVSGECCPGWVWLWIETNSQLLHCTKLPIDVRWWFRRTINVRTTILSYVLWPVKHRDLCSVNRRLLSNLETAIAVSLSWPNNNRKTGYCFKTTATGERAAAAAGVNPYLGMSTIASGRSFRVVVQGWGGKVLSWVGPGIRSSGGLDKNKLRWHCHLPGLIMPSSDEND